MITPDSERTMRTDLGAAATLSPMHVSAADFKGVSLLHAEGYLLYIPGLLEHILEMAKKAGCVIALDLSSFDVVKMKIGVLPELLEKYVDIVFANEDEAREFCSAQGVPFTPETAARILGGLCEVAAVKLGKDGALIRKDGQDFRVGAELVKAVDTTGAGDLWQAGFLYGYVNGKSPDVCAKMGAVLGAEVVQVIGAEIPAGRWPSIIEKLSSLK
jgi:sugar/nucleoside kinase (ribokinase family)